MVLQGLPVPEECVANLFREGVDLRSVIGLAQTSGGLESGRIDLLGLFGENPAGALLDFTRTNCSLTATSLAIASGTAVKIVQQMRVGGSSRGIRPPAPRLGQRRVSRLAAG